MRQNHNILFIDDDESLTQVVAHQLQTMGFTVDIANRGAVGLDKFRQKEPDLVLLDLQMPDMHGMEVLRAIRAINPSVPVIIGTAYGTVDNAVEACRQGADDYLTKPFAKEQLRFAIEKTMRLKMLEQENARLHSELDDKFQFGRILTRNKEMKALLQLCGRAAQSDAAVLITGESGVGKELLAKAIHHNSPRRDKPFLAVNCPSIPESLVESELFGHEKGAFTGAVAAKPGKFELAQGGTLLLDEIGDLKLDLQAKLLRVLQEHEIERVGGVKALPVDVRVLAATNQNLAELAARGQFRQDLYYRLNVIPITIPPLRQRLEDIPLLVEHFVQKHSTQPKVPAASFLKKLMASDWPGNVRELENIVQRAVVLSTSQELTEADIQITPMANRVSVGINATLQETEKRAIIKALKQTNWNQSRAADLLDIPRHVLIYRMKKMDIHKEA